MPQFVKNMFWMSFAMVAIPLGTYMALILFVLAVVTITT